MVLFKEKFPDYHQIVTKLISKFFDPPNPNECRSRTWNTGGDLMDYKQITKNDIKLVLQIVTKLKKEKRKREFLVLLFYGFIL